MYKLTHGILAPYFQDCISYQIFMPTMDWP